MSAWNANGSIVPKEQAQTKIIELAKSKGLSGAFKVFYDNNLVDDPDNLPESVDMNKVKVSAVLNQA
jgi:hypothetical protein